MSDLTKVSAILEELLGDNKKCLDVVRCEISENNTSALTTVKVEIKENEELIIFSAEGDGFVDAFFTALMRHYQDDYRSLQNMSLSRYEVRALIKRSENLQSKAEVVVELGVKTPSSKEILFLEKDTSVVRASTKLVRNAVQFMINCEEAVKIVNLCLQTAQTSGRVDSVTKYTSQLVELVKITSYEKILSKRS